MKRGRSVTIRGATGGTGSAILRRSLAAGDDVTVLVRDCTRLPYPAGGIRVVVGDATDPEAVATVVDGSDVVFSAIGRRPAVLPTRHVSVCEQASANVIRAVGDQLQRRYVVVSSTGMHHPKDRGFKPWERLINSVLRHAYRADFIDRDREAVLLEASALNWTLIRPSMLVGGEAGRYAVHRERIVGPWTTREAVADFAMRVSNDPSYERVAPFMSSWYPAARPTLAGLTEYIGSDLPN